MLQMSIDTTQKFVVRILKEKRPIIFTLEKNNIGDDRYNDQFQ